MAATRRRTGALLALGMAASTVVGLGAPGTALADASSSSAAGSASRSASLSAPGSTPATLAEAKADLVESSQAMVDAVVALREAEAQLPAAREEAGRAADRLSAVRGAYDRAVARQSALQAGVMDAQRHARDTEDAAKAERLTLGRMARQAYIAGTPSQLPALLGVGASADFDTRVTLAHIAGAQERTVQEAVSMLAGVHADATRLEGQRQAAQDAAHDATQALAAVAAQEAAAEAALARVSDLVRARGTAIKDAQSAQAEDAAQYAQMQREGQATTAKIASSLPPASTSEATPAVRGVLIPPVEGRISSPFGMRVHPITHVYKLHTGTDFSVPCGTPVHTAADGTVLEAGVNTAYGNRVVVVHEVGPTRTRIATTYNHMQRVEVRDGQVLTQGEVLGHVGTTGYSTGCHMHFEVLSGGKYVDPMNWL